MQSNLDIQVARALGLNVVGQALYYHDPESGLPVVDMSQTPDPEGYNGCMKKTTGWIYSPVCVCSDLDCPPAVKNESSDLGKVLGHFPLCLQVVPYFSQDPQEVAKIMAQYRIGVLPKGDTLWEARWNEVAVEGEIFEEVVLRAFVEGIRKGYAKS